MRVLIVADVIGGVRTFTAELTRALLGRGVEVDLALLGRWREARELARMPTASCEVRDLALEWMPAPWRDVEATGEWIAELAVRHRPDLVHMNTFAPVHDSALPVLLTVHSCVLTWWRAVLGHDAPPEWDRYRSVARAALERAMLVTVPTRRLLEELSAVHPRLPGARVIPNGRALEDPGGAARHRRWPLVLSVGRFWDPAKNARLVARAAPAIRGRTVLIGPSEVGSSEVGSREVGPGEVDSGGVPAGGVRPGEVGRGGVGPRGIGGLERLGALSPSAVLRWMGRAAVFAEPARYEPFGLAALEAALSGCALVLGAIPSLREVWGEAAAYVDPDDHEGLAAAINTLLEDPRRRSAAVLAARARAARYTPAAMAEGYLDAYRELTHVAVAA